ncbi:uncharacterized protein F4812DRAFT_456411 [Daldinia caldariorum]|uniref:uncharacterized protein n=1 Tax=Daldinia caldariorum TaxID=326644 RepID=UPI002008688B|nr:uncharacterized protein F4812DRAFT_456411 [Daldinia caldariorum]KAI1470403.1 hypothetical protein F4812DRAFT_456411 [Daldinia caldariorum]
MDDFPKNLIIGIVVSAVVVVVSICLIYYLALNWSKLVRRVAPNRFAEPPSEKTEWPQLGKSVETDFSPTSSSISSPRSSRMSPDPVISHFKSDDGEPITPPPNVKA